MKNKLRAQDLFSRMLYDVVLVWSPHATLLYSVACIFEEMLYGVVENVAFVWPRLCQTRLNNIQECATNVL